VHLSAKKSLNRGIEAIAQKYFNSIILIEVKAVATESELIKQAKQGDLQAFECLVLQHQRQAYSIAYRFMGNHEDASDLAQEAFVRAFQSISKFREESSFKTWIHHIVANVCRDELRRRNRHPVSSLDEPVLMEDNEVYRQTADWSMAPDRLYEQKEIQVYLHKLINSLTPEFKMVVVMRELQGFSYEEIAAIIGCSLGTVKSRLSRARQALRDRIAADRELLLTEARLLSRKGETP
jgi:RNA polymerase sigma-70 factor (ECF subfamily)